jgi:glycosyltransferase involved in cell wall biosynthesis
MITSPFFTIITASQNNDTTIERTLTSIKAQSFNNFEHIIIDGNSNDKTLKLIKEHENTYNLRWISEPDSGIAEALNKGLRLARGKYIYILGADDYLIDGIILSNVNEAIKDERYDIYSSPVIVDHPARGKFYFKPFRFIWWHHFKTIFPHQGTFVHIRLFNKVGKFCEDFSISFDYDFFYRALIFRPTIKFGSKPISIMGGAGISSNQDFINWRLNEEYLIQRLNETKTAWKILQEIFRRLYYPYKTRFVPAFKKKRLPVSEGFLE